MDSLSANKLFVMGVVGFIAGIMLAPDKGSVTRDKLKRRANKLADETRAGLEQSKHKLDELKRKKKSSSDEPDMAFSQPEPGPAP